MGANTGDPVSGSHTVNTAGIFEILPDGNSAYEPSNLDWAGALDPSQSLRSGALQSLPNGANRLNITSNYPVEQYPMDYADQDMRPTQTSSDYLTHTSGNQPYFFGLAQNWHGDMNSPGYGFVKAPAILKYHEINTTAVPTDTMGSSTAREFSTMCNIGSQSQTEANFVIRKNTLVSKATSTVTWIPTIVINAFFAAERIRCRSLFEDILDGSTKKREDTHELRTVGVGWIPYTL